MNINELKEILKQVGSIDSFTNDQAVIVMQKFIKLVSEAGLNERNTKDIRVGFSKVFNIKFYNLPNFENGNYILVPNHISEFDGPILGILHQKMLIVAKKEWAEDLRLKYFFEQFFKIIGVDRNDNASKVKCLRTCIEHLKNNNNATVTIFPQQTIADVNNCNTEDIADGPRVINLLTKTPIIPVFLEQPSFDYSTRIVFGEPINIKNQQDFGKVWLEEEIRLQESLIEPKARRPILNAKHSIPISKRHF